MSKVRPLTSIMGADKIASENLNIWIRAPTNEVNVATCKGRSLKNYRKGHPLTLIQSYSKTGKWQEEEAYEGLPA